MEVVFHFFLPIVGVVILIWLLTLLQYGVDSAIPKNTGDSREQKYATDEHKADVDEARHGSVANAIHTYRRTREADERDRAKRERVTIIVLISTAIFAFLAAVAAGASAWIFYGQLDTMRATREESNRSASDQLKLLGDQTKAIQGQLSQMQEAQRAWIELDEAKAVNLTVDHYYISILVDFVYKNVGHSPAEDVTVYPDLVISDDSGRLANLVSES
jgi:flagellar basal body-associated protein FliL